MTKDARIKRHLRRQRRRRIVGFTATGFVIAAAACVVAFGSTVLADRAGLSQQFDVAQAVPVSAQYLKSVEGFGVTRTFLGQVEAAASADLSFELGGLITDVVVQEGQLVSQGDVVARLDTGLLAAEHDRLLASRAGIEAQLEFALTRLTRAKSLLGEGFASQEAVDQSISARDELASRIRELDAALASVDINLAKSVLYAPFSGRVGATFMDAGETTGGGNPIVSVIKLVSPEIRVGLPLSVDLSKLTQATIKIGGTEHRADLIQVRPDIDPTTRTRTVLFRLLDDAPVVVGQTATLVFETRIKERGAWVAFDALSANADGAWNVLVIDDEDTVRAAMVEVLHVEAERAFIRGTFPEEIRVVTSGAHRVVPGQTVTVQIAGL